MDAAERNPPDRLVDYFLTIGVNDPAELQPYHKYKPLVYLAPRGYILSFFKSLHTYILIYTHLLKYSHTHF